MVDAHIIDPATPLHVSKSGREELMATAEAHFDCVIGELRAMRDRFVLEGDAASLESLAQNLEAETF